MPSSDRSNKRRQRIERGQGKKDDDDTFRPKLSDFKRRTAGEAEREKSRSYSRGYMSRRGREGARSLQARRMNNIFEDFRNSIESIMKPWSPYWERFPFTSRLGMEEEEYEGMIRTPLYDMVDNGDKYELKVELPGIEKDKIRVNATDE
jgi:hypothetical protein